MAYAVKEIFLTLQGEGMQAGSRAVFLRFAGCNLWTGREEDRFKAVCQFCDTEFVGIDGVNGGKFAEATALSARVADLWGEGRQGRLVVITGGEPLLQLDTPLIDALHAEGFRIAVESNGTISAPEDIDWLCVSPKYGSELVQTSGDELKLVWPQPFDLDELEALDFDHFLLQPMDGEEIEKNTEAAIQLVMDRPRWRLSLQTHKILGLA
ncbi:7-carboxy-7-deazaguanine synthase [Sphingomicrobium nitratireducens]|uniref:7-carboxy-7-deazaguanine synthase n=1 Tax=Sphingomicrobium nitratireducens TaxID=2964666 RepID=UPI00223F6BD0|nr:7-carboxy-7-deazaguanine synthase [Sphingomicrobium nitratireducens]